MTRQHVDDFAGSVDIFKFGQLFAMMEKGETAKLQFASHATFITGRGASATVGNMKCQLLARGVGESAH